MISLLASIGKSLAINGYANEAAVREGIVMPILRELGWNPSDPTHLKPEHYENKGFADYVLFGRAGKPAVVIEVKAVGRALMGDRQLFRYCFDMGAPLAILTDGRTWDFYFPAGQGTLEDRRIYSLQIDDRSPEECERIFARYLDRERVLNRSAISSVREDHERAADRREAVAALPQAWKELVGAGDDTLLELLQDKAEGKSGYRPDALEALHFLQQLKLESSARPAPIERPKASAVVGEAPTLADGSRDLSVTYKLFGQRQVAANASRALVDILRVIVARDPGKIEQLSETVRTARRNHIARSPQATRPDRPDTARAEEISPGWFVGVNIANRDKAMILRAACEAYGLSMPQDLKVALPNA